MDRAWQNRMGRSDGAGPAKARLRGLVNQGERAKPDAGSASAVVCRPRPGRNPPRADCAGPARTTAVDGALRRDQPRHRAAGASRPRAGERIRAHARPVHGRRLSVPGEIRLRDGRSGRGGTGRTAAASSSRSIRTRASSPCRPRPSCRYPTACRRAARCSPPTWRPRSTPCGTRRPAPADRIAVVGGRRGRLAGARGCAGRIPGAEVTLVDIEPSRAELAARARRRLCAAGGRADGLRPRRSMPAGPRRALRPRCGSRATRRPSSS